MRRCYHHRDVDARLRSESYSQGAVGATFIVYERGYDAVMVQRPGADGHVSADALDQHVVDRNVPWLTQGLTSFPC